MATVTFDHVTKKYADDAVAVDDLELDIADGELLLRSKDYPRAAAVLGAYPHDIVLLRVASPPYSFMMAQLGWQVVYRDKVAALFARANSPAAQLKDIPIEGRPGSDFFP